MKPSLGRILIVPVVPQRTSDAVEAPAIVTRVWSDTLVNVRVLADNNEVAELRTSVTIVDEPSLGHVAWWPPRV